MSGMPKCEREMLAALEEKMRPSRDWASRAQEARRVGDLAAAASAAIARAAMSGSDEDWKAAIAASAAAQDLFSAARRWLNLPPQGATLPASVEPEPGLPVALAPERLEDWPIDLAEKVRHSGTPAGYAVVAAASRPDGTTGATLCVSSRPDDEDPQHRDRVSVTVRVGPDVPADPERLAVRAGFAVGILRRPADGGS